MQGFSLLISDKNVVTKKVNGHMVKFREFNLKSILALRSLAPSITKSLAFFKDDSADHIQRTIKREKDKEGNEQSTQEFKELSIDLYYHRLTKREEAYTSLADAFLGDSTIETVFGAIKSSMREVPEIQSMTSKQFLEEITPSVMMEIFEGVKEANKKVLEPFLPMLKDMGNIIPMSQEAMQSQAQAEQTTQKA